MSYKKSLQTLLDGIEKCESIAQISKTIDPVQAMNEAIKGLSTENWKIEITDRFTWAISSTGERGMHSYEKVTPGLFEDFRDSLMVSVAEHLKDVEANNYEHIKDFREKAVAPALKVISNFTEDLYEDAMYAYRRCKDHDKIVAGIDQRKQNLLDYAVSVAEEWVKENITTGTEVFYDSPSVRFPKSLVVDKVTKIGGSTLITFKDTDITSSNFDSIDFLETWFVNVDDARGICDRIVNISSLRV